MEGVKRQFLSFVLMMNVLANERFLFHGLVHSTVIRIEREVSNRMEGETE